MPLIPAHTLDVNNASPQIYCAMDSCLTTEILPELHTLLPTPDSAIELQGPKLIYAFERALQAPAMEMSLRGFRIDPWAREAGITELRRRLKRLSFIIDAYAAEIWNKRSPTKRTNDYPAPILLNPDSEKQLQEFFYEAMKIPKITRYVGGVQKLPMDRQVLEKLETYFIARPVIAAILAWRDTAGQLEVMECEMDDDWRIRYSFNMSATSTGRASSSESVTGSGRNVQNVEESLRYQFISDEGKKLLGADYEQAESRDTGWLCWVLFGDPSYLDGVESGDCHTDLARICWPNLDWNGEKGHDRQIAEQPFYRHHSRRDIAKRLRHGTEKGGGYVEIAHQIRVPNAIVKEAQEKLFTTYPCVPHLFTWVAGQIQREHYLVNAFGRRRDFFGRADSSDTIKEAIAFMSQSPTADRTNLALWRVWKHMGPKATNPVELLVQLHDAIYCQRSEDVDEGETIKIFKSHLDVPLSFRGRMFTVPTEVKTGWCWSNAYQMDNEGTPILTHPNGLMKWIGQDDRVRQQSPFTPTRSAA